MDEKVDQLAEELEKTLRTLDEEVPNQSGASSSEAKGSSATTTRKRIAESPWNYEEFQKPPRLVSDQWRLDLYEEGWVIRTHGKARKAPFHPVHRSFPGDSGQLGDERVTAIFDSTGNREVRYDCWNGRPWRFEDREKTWKGYTFFRKKADVAAEVATTKPTIETQSSDGSFEHIED